MNIVMNTAKQVILDKLEAEVHTAEAKLNTLKARGETPKANIEIRAITELLTRKRRKLQGPGVEISSCLLSGPRPTS